MKSGNCKHYTGALASDCCREGIIYRNLVKTNGFLCKLPCSPMSYFHDKFNAVSCSKFTPITLLEEQKWNSQVTAEIEATLAKLARGEHAPNVIVTRTPEPCEHDWDNDGQNPEYCLKCGMSFMRYVHMECP